MADNPILPKDTRQLRACLLCSLVKNLNQFIKDGCENCDDILRMKGKKGRTSDCTTANFEGLVAMMDPEVSWVSRWQRIDKFAKGVYALRVFGRVPEDVEDQLEARGLRYRLRDGSEYE